MLPVPYFHVVFTLPPAAAEIAFENKQTVYGLLMRAAAQALMTLAAARLAARIGLIAVLHTWGQTLTHHPHVHCLVPGGGVALLGERWVGCKPNFLLSVRALSKTFRRLFLDGLAAVFRRGELGFFGELAPLADPGAFAERVRALRKSPFVVYAKPPFGGPERVLAYLARYTHRTAIANSRLVAVGEMKLRSPTRTIVAAGAPASCASPRTSSSGVSCSTSCPTASTASGITASSPGGTVPKPGARARPRERRGPPPSPPTARRGPRPSAATSGPDDRTLARCPDCGGRMRRTGLVAPSTGPFRCDTS